MSNLSWQIPRHSKSPKWQGEHDENCNVLAGPGEDCNCRAYTRPVQPFDVAGRVNAVVVSILRVDGDDLMIGVRLREELGADDLSLAELVMTLEDELDIDLDNKLRADYVTVDDLVEACERAVAAKRSIQNS